jgi:hypothetical protein
MYILGTSYFVYLITRALGHDYCILPITALLGTRAGVLAVAVDTFSDAVELPGADSDPLVYDCAPAAGKHLAASPTQTVPPRSNGRDRDSEREFASKTRSPVPPKPPLMRMTGWKLPPHGTHRPSCKCL